MPTPTKETNALEWVPQFTAADVVVQTHPHLANGPVHDLIIQVPCIGYTEKHDSRLIPETTLQAIAGVSSRMRGMPGHLYAEALAAVLQQYGLMITPYDELLPVNRVKPLKTQAA